MRAHYADLESDKPAPARPGDRVDETPADSWSCEGGDLCGPPEAPGAE